MKSLILIAILTLSAASLSWAAADSPIAPAIVAPPLTSTVPPLINYQGTLTDDNGVPIPDGPRKLEFNLYDHPLAGNKVWGPQVFDDVPVVNGRFNIILGPVDNNSSQRSLTAAFGGSDRYLGFKVGASGADLSAIAEIAPRQAILAAPYAINALHGVPVGTIVQFGGNQAPDGWLLCDGTAINRLDYGRLFSVIGTQFSNGDGINTFNLPNFSRRTPIGAGGVASPVIGNKVGNYGGAETHTLTVAEMPSHNHKVHDTNHIATPASVDNIGTEYGNRINNYGTTDLTGGTQAHNTMQPSLVVIFIIKHM